LLWRKLRSSYSEDFTYTATTTEVTITWYKGAGGAVTIPSSIGGLPVTSIERAAFNQKTTLTSVTIPNSVTSIGDYAFQSCTGLTSVTIPNSVTSIGYGAFSYCTGLTSVTIPNSVTSIGYGAFSYCTGLTSVTVDAANPSYSSIAGVLFDKNQTALITYPAGKTGSYTIPNSVTSIGYEAFSGCTGLTSITIPNSVTSISYGAFSGCTGLTSITIPNSVTSIGEGAFSGFTGLTSITIPNSVTSIGYEAFSGCTGLTGVTIPNSVTSIGNAAFYGCTGLTSITIPNSVTSIGYEAFYGCTGLTSVGLPEQFITDIEFIGLTGQVAASALIHGVADNLGSNTEFITNFTNSVLSKNGNYGLSTKTDLTTAVAPLASDADIATAIAPLARKADLEPLATKTELASSLEALSTNPAFVAALVNNPAFMAALANQIASDPNNFGLSIKQKQTLTFKAIAAQTYVANKTLRLSATSSAKLTPITYVSSNPAVATVTKNVVKLIGRGTTTITATQAGNSNYNSTSMSRELLVK